MRGVLFLSFFNLLLTTTAAAQATDDFATLADRHRDSQVTVVLDSGETAMGRLLRSTPDIVALGFARSELVYRRENVDAVYKRATAVKKGMLVGVLSGVALSLLAVASDQGDYSQAAGVVLVPLGFLIGAGVGAAIPTKRLIYEVGGVSW
jgi:hypothetical protein